MGSISIFSLSADVFIYDQNIFCNKLADLSVVAMKARQEGVNKSEFMAYINAQPLEDSEENKILFKYAFRIIDVAFQYPIIEQQDSISEVTSVFDTAQRSSCMSSMKMHLNAKY